MKSKLIRILIVLCFVGMVVFGVIVFLSNHNVEQKVYSEITKIRDNADFDKLYKGANSVQSAYTPNPETATVCGYVDYANDAIQYLNEGIDYYLYYFQDMSGMNKKEKDKVVSAYKAYISAINDAKSKLAIYESFEKKLSPSENDIRQISACSAAFAIEYLEAYTKGYQVLMQLQSLVDENVFGNKMFKSFVQIKYEMAANFVNNSVSAVVGVLETKKSGQTISTSNPYSINTSANNFNLIYNYNKINAGYEFREQNHAKFVANYNEISDARAFLTDSSTYSANNSSEASYCTSIKTFLASTYGISI